MINNSLYLDTQGVIKQDAFAFRVLSDIHSGSVFASGGRYASFLSFKVINSALKFRSYLGNRETWDLWVTVSVNEVDV